MLLKFGIYGREMFGSFLNERLLTGFAVEVGTHQGDFAKKFLTTWHGQKLFCVDPWTIPPGYEHQASFLWGSESRESDMQKTEMNLSKFISVGRCDLIRKMSLDAALNGDFPPLDFVHLDGDHSAEAIKADLEAWWPRIKPGGVLAGHDIVCPGEVDGGWAKGIQPAVFAFCARHGLDVYLVPELTELPWSFFIEKPQ